MGLLPNPAEEGFPFEKVDAARRYLHTVKPWWSRFGGKMKIVPSYRPPAPGSRYGAMTSTDPQFRLYVDRTFATVVSLENLAGSIEHEYQHHTRDTWKRLRWLSLEEWDRWANISIDLEINGVIEAEAEALTMEEIEVLCSRSAVFSKSELVAWGVKSAPTLRGVGGWIPQELGMPSGLSAEEYLELLRQSEQMKQEKEESEEEKEDSPSLDAEPEPDGGESSRDQEDEQDSGNGSQGDDEGSDDASDPDSTQEASEGAERGSEGAESDQGESDDAGDPGESDDAAQSEVGGDVISDGGDVEGDADGAESDHPSAEGQQTDAQSQGGAGRAPVQMDPSEYPDGLPSSQAQPGNGVAAPDGDGVVTDQAQPDVPQPSAEIAERVDEHRSTEEGQMWAHEVINPDDPLAQDSFKPDEMVNESPVNEGEIERAFMELEEDVLNSRGDSGFGIAPGSKMVDWAFRRRRARHVNWESKFARLLNSQYQSARIQGASDLSYSVRNPNQPEIGPIFQGLHDYAPQIVVIQDVSWSMVMNERMERSVGAFQELCTKVLSRYSVPITWITVDTDIVGVGRAAAWTPGMEREWKKGYGGTSLGPVISDVMNGRFRWKNHRINKRPDLVIVNTDCGFEWPRPRPNRSTKLLVVSVGDQYTMDRNLPMWLNKKLELVVVDR